MPDFLLVSKDDNQAYLVEVKYRNEITLEDIKDVARAVLEKHKYPWLFVASKTGFFFDSCNNILNYHEPTPNPLNESWVDSNTQNEFLTILNEFIG